MPMIRAQGVYCVLALILQSGAARSADSCGQGFGDLRNAPGAAEACVRCKGATASLDFNPHLADGLGLTSCTATTVTQAPPSTSQEGFDEHCGEGYGDSSTSVSAEAACRMCKGMQAVLLFRRDLADGVGRTICLRATLDAEAASTTPAIIADTTRAPLDESPRSLRGAVTKFFPMDFIVLRYPIVVFIALLLSLQVVLLKLWGNCLTGSRPSDSAGKTEAMLQQSETSCKAEAMPTLFAARSKNRQDKTETMPTLLAARTKTPEDKCFLQV